MEIKIPTAVTNPFAKSDSDLNPKSESDFPKVELLQSLILICFS